MARNNAKHDGETQTMTQTATICLLNDSFPPLIDGVANAVKNYAQVISDSGFDSVVITPAHPDSSDEDYPYSTQCIPCSMAKWIPIECSGFHAAWPNGSRLNAVDSMQCGAVDSD